MDEIIAILFTFIPSLKSDTTPTTPKRLAQQYMNHLTIWGGKRFEKPNSIAAHCSKSHRAVLLIRQKTLQPCPCISNAVIMGPGSGGPFWMMGINSALAECKVNTVSIVYCLAPHDCFKKPVKKCNNLLKPQLHIWRTRDMCSYQQRLQTLNKNNE